jgi:hypothetical protein
VGCSSWVRGPPRGGGGGAGLPAAWAFLLIR